MGWLQQAAHGGILILLLLRSSVTYMCCPWRKVALHK